MPSFIRVLQSDADDVPAALLSAAKSPAACGADQAAEAEALARDRQLVARVVDDLDRADRVRAALVQLPGRVQVARAEPDA